jgi:uncharacterized spore protein YtfJ
VTNQINFDRFMDEFADTRKQASVDAVFGTPIESEGKTVIPIASVAFGFGMGGGSSEPAPAPAQNAKGSSDIGGGMGSGYITRPMALAVIDKDGVQIKPIMNEERIAILGIMTGAWSVFWLARILLRLIGKIPKK